MQARRKYKALALTGALAALIAAGCSSSKSSSSSTTSGGGSATTSGGGSATTSGGSATTSGSGGGGNGGATAPGVTATTIKVGFITSVTGNASSTFSDSEKGALAAFTAINNAGGINGRKIELVTADDQSSPTGDLSAMQSVISQGVFMIENYSPYLFGGFKVATTAGIPVIGGGFDGPEWATSNNMFSYLGGVSSDEYNNTTQWPNFFKLVGATSVGGLAYGISPSSIASINSLAKGLQAIGLKMGYQNLTVPFGSVDVTSYVLAMKQAGVNGAACSCVQSTNLAMFTGLKQAGMTNVKALSFASADSSVFSNATTAQAAQGAYFNTLIPPPDVNSTATTTFMQNVAAVDPSYKVGTIPSFGLTGAYLAAEVGLYGLNLVGPALTRANFINKMNQQTNFNAGGLLATTVGWANRGTPPAQTCSYYVQVSGTNFVTINNKQPICGKPLAS
jgi:branched-chain amino acid transport system substrate-binding protein